MNPQLLPLNDDHGDQFPGALPARISDLSRHQAADERLVRMRAAYVHKVNAVVEAGRDDLADELATAYASEAAASRLAASGRRAGGGRGTPARTGTGGPSARSTGGVRALIRRFDRSTPDSGTPTRRRG